MSTDVQDREPDVAAEAATDEAPQPPAGEQQLQRARAAANIGFGLTARNWEEGFRIANQLAKSALVPKGYFDKPQDILVAMQLGAELGLPPMQSLQSIAVINGRPSIYGDGFLAVIMASSSYARHSEYYLVDGQRKDFLSPDDLKLLDTTAVSSFWRKGNPDPFTATFSIADAMRADLLGKAGPWKQYPARMLRFRARGFAGRDAFAGDLRGMKTAEEVHDTPIDVTVEAITNSPPSSPVRRSERVASAAAGAEVASTASQAAPENGSDNGKATKPAGAGTTPAAAKGKPDAGKQTGPGWVVKNVRITETALVEKPKDGSAAYYEIKAVDGDKSGVGYVFITRDEQISRMAASCEGSDSKFNITGHTLSGAAAAAKDVKVITGLAAAH